MLQTKPKKKKLSKAKIQAFKDLKEEETYYYLPFHKWLNRYVFS